MKKTFLGISSFGVLNKFQDDCKMKAKFLATAEQDRMIKIDQRNAGVLYQSLKAKNRFNRDERIAVLVAKDGKG